MNNLQLRNALSEVADEQDRFRAEEAKPDVSSGDNTLVLVKSGYGNAFVVKGVELKRGITLIRVEEL